MRARATRLVLAGSVCALYPLVLRERILHWGATDSEAESSLPGDELLDGASQVSTRAIAIDAPARAVWPWLAQMGPSPRGGAYTYDWIENLLKLDMHSADRVLPEFQHPQLGDTIVFGSSTMRLERVEPDHLISWRSADGSWVWTFVIARDGDGTRLISRNRYRLPTVAARLGMLPMEPASLVMEQKMLRGIKQRAERLAEVTPSLRLSDDERTGERRAPRSPQTTTAAAAGGPGG
jgi:hypothetical protein